MFKNAMALLLISSSLLFASAELQIDNDKGLKINIKKNDICQQLIASNVSVEELQRSGCCSWHGGVCGCSNGRAACCDGTLSPSCDCN